MKININLIIEVIAFIFILFIFISISVGLVENPKSFVVGIFEGFVLYYVIKDWLKYLIKKYNWGEKWQNLI